MLDALSIRLQALLDEQARLNDPLMFDAIASDLETVSDLEDEWAEEDEQDDSEEPTVLSPAQIEEVRREKQLIDEFRLLATSIRKNSKGAVLLVALQQGFEMLEKLGALKKAVIFTESTRTQKYLLEIFEGSDYRGKVVLFNGSHSDPKSKEIYQRWLTKYLLGTDKVTGSASADMRAALIEYFREKAVVLIATKPPLKASISSSAP